MNDTGSELLRDSVLRMLHRDLAAMRREVEAYPDDASLWRVVPGIANAGGTLALHLAGNLRHFVGAILGDTGYTRDRDREFSVRDLTRAEVAAELGDAMRAVSGTLRALDPARVCAGYPIAIGKDELTAPTGTFLVHLATHAAYHLGQVDYHRRIVTGDGTTVDAQALQGMVAPLGNLA